MVATAREVLSFEDIRGPIALEYRHGRPPPPSACSMTASAGVSVSNAIHIARLG